jgi:hypothetical protein
MPSSDAIPLYFLMAFVVAIPVWALLSGGKAAKAAAVVFFCATIASKFVELNLPARQSGTIFLFIDGLMALFLLAIALVYSYLWISLMMLSVSFVFCIHAYYQINSIALDPSFALVSNIATAVLLVSLAIGVWTSRRRTAEHA